MENKKALRLRSLMDCIIDKIDSLEGDESSLLPIANRLEW